MSGPAFNISAIAVIGALALFAIRINRHDRHPFASAFLWICTFVLLAWASLIWFVRP
jgi:hypothetical protein